MAGYQAGAALGKERERKTAMGLLTQEPDNPGALLRLGAVDPAAAADFQRLRTNQVKADQDTRFRGAATRWGLRQNRPNQNTLGSLVRGQSAPMLAPQGDPSSQGVLANSASPAIPAMPADGADAPDIVVTGQRQTAPADDGSYADMMTADPERALKFRSALAGVTKDDLDVYEHVNAASLQLMGGVHDQASYDDAKTRAHDLHERFGVGPDAMDLPDQYDPQMVHGLMMQAMTTSQQLAAVRAQTKLEWDVQDDQIDNARADRNTGSMIDDRNRRRGLIARGQDMTDTRGRYGIGVASADRRRGQDMIDTRVRSRPGPAATQGSGGGKVAKVAVDAHGNKVGWNGKAWVPVK